MFDQPTSSPSTRKSGFDETRPKASADTGAASYSSLVCMNFGSNVGFAIAPLEVAFFQLCLTLAGGDPNRVHFAYPSLRNGMPQCLPARFGNVIEFDFQDTSPESIERVCTLAHEADISFALFFDLQPVHPVCLPLRRAGVHTIVSYWGAQISSLMPQWRLLLRRLQLRLSRSKVDGLIFESFAMARYATQGRGVLPSMIDVVPLGVDVERFSPEPSSHAHEVLGIPPNRKIVFYAGHMEPRKGVHVLIEAALSLLDNRDDFVVVICGNRPGEEDRFHELFPGLENRREIIFAGYRDDVPQILRGCYCGVIPSTGWDSFPRTMIEMAAAGLPVVASRLQGIPEGVLDGETGLLFEPGDVAGLVNRLARLLDDPAEARRLGERGRMRAATEFTLDTQHRRLLSAVRRRLERV